MAIESRKQTAWTAPAPITREARAIIFGRDAALRRRPNHAEGMTGDLGASQIRATNAKTISRRPHTARSRALSLIRPVKIDCL
jgi:hypothetical protein